MFAALILVSLPVMTLPLPCAWSAVFSISLLSISAYLVQGPHFGLSKKLVDIGVAGQLLTFNASYWVLYYLPPVRSMAFGHTVLDGIVFLTVVYLWLSRNWSLKKLAAIVESGVDHGEEQIQTNQSKIVWPIMYFLFFVVVFLCRFVCNWETISNGNLPMVREAFLTGLVSIAWLIALVCSKIPHFRVKIRSRGYTIIERMTAGLVVGYFFGVFSQMTIPLWITALVIPAASILVADLRALEKLLKSHGCVHGIVTGSAIVVGINYAVTQIGIAYGVVVVLYYIWHGVKRLPVYFPPSMPRLANLMGKVFVKEVC